MSHTRKQKKEAEPDAKREKVKTPKSSKIYWWSLETDFSVVESGDFIKLFIIFFLLLLIVITWGINGLFGRESLITMGKRVLMSEIKVTEVDC